MRPMPRVPPFDRPATYDDLVKVPDNLVAEIVDGELHASPRPAPPMSSQGPRLAVAIGGPYFHGRGGPGGWWILDEPELHLGADVARARPGGLERDPHAASARHRLFPPRARLGVRDALAFDRRLDRVAKLGIYARERVAHAWLIDPSRRRSRCSGSRAGAGCSRLPMPATTSCASSRSRRSTSSWPCCGRLRLRRPDSYQPSRYRRFG